MKSAFIYIGAVVFLTACTSSIEESTGSLTTKVMRGPKNQISVQVAPKTTGVVTSVESLQADLALVEAEGFAVASDRFLQMDLLRRYGRGRLAELFGESAYNKDRLTIGVGLPYSVDNSVKLMQEKHPETYLVLAAYAAGVNRFVENIEKLQPDLLKQYRQITFNPGYRPAPWEPNDSVAVASGLSFLLSSSLEDKLSLTALLVILTKTNRLEEFYNFLDLRPIKDTFIVGKKGPRPPPVARRPVFSTNKLTLLKSLVSSCKNQGFPFPDCGKKPGLGSNNWVVSKAFTNSGETYLANDPHLPLTFPMTMYEVALDSKSAGGSIYSRGVKPVGVPGVLIGHNENIAWGLTNLGADVDDVYLEVISGNTTTVGGKTVEILPLEQTILVRLSNGGLEKRPIVLRVVPGHGPIFSDHHPRVQEFLKSVSEEGIFGQNIALSYKWTGHPGTTEFVAIWELNRAKNFQEFKRALSHFKSGAQNIVYADREGNIGYLSQGDFPVRKYLHKDYPPFMMVTSGMFGTREWEAEFKQDVPQSYKSDGFIVTANNDPFGMTAYPFSSGYDEYLGYGFADGIRAFRITDLLVTTKAQKGKLTAADMQAIQIDTKDVLAQELLNVAALAKPAEKLSAEGLALYQKLNEWRDSGAGSDVYSLGTGPAYDWIEALSRGYFADVKGAIEGKEGEGYDAVINDMLITSPFIKTVYHKVKDGLLTQTGPQFDKMQSLVVRSLEEAGKKYALEGPVPWGKRNRLVFANMLAGIVPSLFTFPIERGGTYETVSPASEGIGACFRIVMTLKPGEPIDALIAVAGGNYGTANPEGAFKELRAWRDGDLRSLMAFKP